MITLHFADYLCCLPIFPARLLICFSNINQLQNTHRRALLFIVSQRFIGRIFTQTKLSSIYRWTYLCLDEMSRVACNSGKTQTRKVVYFSVAIGPRKKSWQMCGKSRETLRLYIQIYPANFLLCYEKAIDLQHIYNLDWRNVEFSWKKKRNTAQSW